MNRFFPAFVGLCLASAALTFPAAASAATLTATSFSYDLTHFGTSSTLSAAGPGFNFTTTRAVLTGNLVENYGAPLFIPVLPDDNANPPSGQVTIGGTTYTVLFNRSSAAISIVPGVVLAAGEPSTLFVPAVAQLQYSACVEFGHLPLCDPNFTAPLADITINLPGLLKVDFTENTVMRNYAVLDASFVTVPEPPGTFLWVFGLPACAVATRFRKWAALSASRKPPHAMMSCITFPATSVKRKSRPL